MDSYPRSGKSKKKSALSRLAEKRQVASDESDVSSRDSDSRVGAGRSSYHSERDSFPGSSRLRFNNQRQYSEDSDPRERHHRVQYDSDEGIGLGSNSTGKSLHVSTPRRSPQHSVDFVDRLGYQSREYHTKKEDHHELVPYRRDYDSYGYRNQSNSQGGSEEEEHSRYMRAKSGAAKFYEDEDETSDETAEKLRHYSSRLSDSADLKQDLEDRYKELLTKQHSDPDGRPSRSVGRESKPRPSCRSPVPHVSRELNDTPSSSLFMSYSKNPAMFDVGSTNSLQSTSVLPQIRTKEAREKSFLVGSIKSHGAFMGSDELERFFPERKMRMFIGTWNMCELKQSPKMLEDFLLPETSEYMYDAYIIGTQESTADRSEWEVSLQETLGPQLVLFHSGVFGVLYLNIFLRRDLIWYCSVSEEAHISTRSGPTSKKTKGAVGVCFTMFGTSFLFINAHFAPHDGRSKERVADYHKISSGLDLPRVNTTNTGDDKDVTSRFDCVFWLGDLNFRLEKERERVDMKMGGIQSEVIPSYEDLVRHDELTRVRNEDLAFQEFQEGRIKFKPTYKFDIGKETYDSSAKMRIPSYTDRILFRCRRKGSVTCLYYGAAHEIMVSDHRPVYAMFEVDLRPGRDNVVMSGGQFNQAVWVEANRRRSGRDVRPKKLESSVCSIQ